MTSPPAAADRRDRLARRQAGGDDILDHQHLGPGLEREAAAELEDALGPLEEHRRTAQRAAHFMADDDPAHRRRDDDVDRARDWSAGSFAASARASRSARAGSISTRAHCR